LSERSGHLATAAVDHQDGTPAVAPAGPRSRLWIAILLFGAAATSLYYAPFLGPNGQAVVYLGIEGLAVAAVFASLRLNRPAEPAAWALIGAGMLSLAIGDAVWYWLSLVENVSPATSLADVFYLGEYPLLIGGMILLVRARPDRATLLDTLMITTGVFVVILEFVVRPSLEGYTGSALDLAVLVAYPIADVALLAVAVRSALTGNIRSPVLLLLLGGLSVTFLADSLYLWISQVNPDFDLNGSPMDAGWLISMISWAAAAMHPAARTKLAADGADWMRQRRARAPLLAAALLLLPATVAVETASGATPFTPALLIAWVLIAVLVILRIDAALTSARMSEERFRTIFEDSPAGMAMARRGLIVLVNDTVRSMFSLGRMNVRTMPLTDFVAPGRRQELIDRIENRAHGEQLPDGFETVGVRSDGSEFALAVGTRDIVLPDGPATIGFLLDVSARKDAEDTVRASERRYRDLFESNPHPMWIYDSETMRFLAVNDTAVRQYGWSAEQFLSMTIADIRPPEDVPALLNLLEQKPGALRTTRAVRHLRATGSAIDVEVTSHELTWEGRPARVVLAIDVTERARLEAQLRQAQKMEAVGQLAGGIAHDFNNLLTAIRGFAELHLADHPPGDAGRADVLEIERAAERATQLTRGLLAFSRRADVHPEPLDLAEVASDAVVLLRRLVGEHIVVRVETAKKVPCVVADRVGIDQVLLNLAANARDAMPSGGEVRITVGAATLDQGFIEAHPGANPGNHVLLEVADTGVGMDEATRSHLFEPFFTTKAPGQGTGLGLASVYGIVKQAHGYIEVESSPGTGSVFRIYLPALEAATPAARVSPVTKQVRNDGTETILLVEDEPAVRLFAKRLLEDVGYVVLAFADPKVALDAAIGNPGAFDALVTDVVMPTMNGTTLAERITEMRPGLPILFMSGYVGDIPPSGMPSRLAKPFSASDLASAVGALFGRSG
jgi:two-component system, cell cycle sensor histidine kinase and response regulator CckA